MRIVNAYIYIKEGCIKIDDDVLIGSYDSRTSIYSENGNCIIGRHAIIGDHRSTSIIKIENGEFILGAFSKFAGSLVWIRFGGVLNIGDYSNINYGTEIRCDESIRIGSYCQISYNIRIWDTNTHEILSKEGRRKRTIDYFPTYGKEINKPKTKPIVIGNDCWIGEYCSIKGCEIGDECILGFHTILSNKIIPSQKTVFNFSEIKMI